MDNPKPVKSTGKFILKVRKGMYRVVDRDCNPVGKWYHFEESNAWTYTDLVTPKGMEGLEVHPHPLKYAVPRCRDKGVE